MPPWRVREACVLTGLRGGSFQAYARRLGTSVSLWRIKPHIVRTPAPLSRRKTSTKRTISGPDSGDRFGGTDCLRRPKRQSLDATSSCLAEQGVRSRKSLFQPVEVRTAICRGLRKLLAGPCFRRGSRILRTGVVGAGGFHTGRGAVLGSGEGRVSSVGRATAL